MLLAFVVYQLADRIGGIMGRIRIVKEYQPEVKQIQYDNDNFERRYTLLCDNYSIAKKEYQTIVLPAASEKILEYIGWGKKTQQNIVEQGGFLVGKNYYDEEKRVNVCVVENALSATGASGSWGHLEIGHEDTREMYKMLDKMNDGCAESEKKVVVGWFHTHPNSLEVFMSGTDRGTQSRLFPGEKAVALVLNPHRKIWKCFRSEQCIDGQAEMLIGEKLFQVFGKDRLSNSLLRFGGKQNG